MSRSEKNSENPRERARHYLPASAADLQAMLGETECKQLRDLFNHIEPEVFFDKLDVPEELGYDALRSEMAAIAARNRTLTSYAGDGLPDFSQHAIVAEVSAIRNLTTAYTPYQPERSQGTLMTHWIYQCLMHQLTGFEAINSSLYDRSTAIHEAICTSLRTKRKADTALILEGLYPGDIEVLRTLTADTDIRLEFVPLDTAAGLTDMGALASRIKELGEHLACVVYPQVNHLGLLEDVDAITDMAAEAGLLSIAVIDPMLLATGGLKPPVDFGHAGADMLAGEGQHLAIGPNFGGPGLGVFGVRYNERHKNTVRATPGRFVGKAIDNFGRDCRVMIMSTREQHIRKDKATSNICSNQAFLATLAGASILARGESGMAECVRSARANAVAFVEGSGLIPAFPQAHFFNEVVVEVDDPAAIIHKGMEAGILAGVDVSARIKGRRGLLKLSFSDRQTAEDIERLISLFGPDQKKSNQVPAIPASYLRPDAVDLPQFDPREVGEYYHRLGELNVSPDDGCYPLGSCTMKYNPLVNDWAAGLEGFVSAHPQAPESAVQGCLEVLYQIQEWFKAITGLPGLTTQPVAGAQGELVGLKLFQAWHRDHSSTPRDILFIPEGAHGTNFATAAMAGFSPRTEQGQHRGIVILKEGGDGQIDFDDFIEKLDTYGDRLCGIMITNPNTRGLFETRFREIADKVHGAGGLVYMDGANMNAIAGWLDLNKLGVDAVHNNLHKTWTIPHGGGGPGDAIVAVSERLVDYLPGRQVVKTQSGEYTTLRMPQSIGSFHRHWGNFAHKVRCLTYLLRLGREGIPRMSAVAVLSARYLYQRLRQHYPTLPAGAVDKPRMHEFIITLSPADFERLEKAGVPRASAITRVGKLFLDFGFHAPTVAWPETYGLMIEPTESYTRAELDRFAGAVLKIRELIIDAPEVLLGTPYFTPVDRVDEVAANRNPVFAEKLEQLPVLNANRVAPAELAAMSLDEIADRIRKAVPAPAAC